MLSRALRAQSRKGLKVEDDQSSCRSVSIYEYEDCIFGFMDIDVPLIFCNDHDQSTDPDRDRRKTGSQLTLREVLRGSLGVMGQGRLGMTEKVVMGRERVCAVKRFKKVTLRRGEFGRCILRLSQVSKECKYIVHVGAYLYSKRIKFVVCDYYPMGTLADLLAGSRELGHTTLNWTQRLAIIQDIAKAVAFIHSLSHIHDTRLHLDVHGNIRSSNVMINNDFTAHLSDYGLAQIANRVQVSDTWQGKPPPSHTSETVYCDGLSQKSDVYNFGVIVLDILAGHKGLGQINAIIKMKEEIRVEEIDFFEINLEGKQMKQASQVLDIALDCTNPMLEARPIMKNVLFNLENIFSNGPKITPY